MKIGFPVLKKDLIVNLMFDKNLHGSNYFGVFNPSDKSFKVMLTEAIYDQDEGMGLIHFLKSEDITSIISPECNPMAAKFFLDNSINTYKAYGTTVLPNIDLFNKNELPLFTEESIVQKKNCSSECGDCNSTCNEKVQELVSI